MEFYNSTGEQLSILPFTNSGKSPNLMIIHKENDGRTHYNVCSEPLIYRIFKTLEVGGQPTGIDEDLMDVMSNYCRCGVEIPKNE